MNLREDFLNKWPPYPSIQIDTLCVLDLIKKFSSYSSGKETPKAEDFWLGGKVYKSQALDKTHYLTLESQGSSLEINFSPDCLLNNYKPMDVLSSGDIVRIRGFWREIQVEGFDVKVKSIYAHSVELLAPSYETYFIENFNQKKSRQWQFFLQSIRHVFKVLDFTEVHTPTLVSSPGTETFLDHFETHFKMGSTVRKFYLPTSPELHLKKMIALGWTRIFEIKSCFRNGEVSDKHQPEFWMLEWYRAYSTFDKLIKDLQGILNYLKLHWPEPIAHFSQIQITTVSDLFLEHTGFKLLPTTTQEELLHLAKNQSINVTPSDSWDDVFYRIFIEKIEPHLGFDSPLVVKNYPPSQAALAKVNSDGWADRFEFYWNGLEIANAFYELNDPKEQQRRCIEDNKERERLGRPPVPIDEDFIRALNSGFPPTAGIALGLDRLFMAIVGINDIKKTRAFPITFS